METALMILDTILAVILIISVVLQSGKSSGLAGALGGGSEGLFTGKAKSSDAMLARVTMITGSLFGLVTLLLAKITS